METEIATAVLCRLERKGVRSLKTSSVAIAGEKNTHEPRKTLTLEESDPTMNPKSMEKE